MDFLKRLLGGGTAAEKPPAEAAPAQTAPATPAPPATIQVFDPYGRAIEVPREEWRTKVLPGRFRECWLQPDALADALTQALHDGFAADALGPARQLHRIDPQGKRSAAILAVALMDLQQHAEAGDVLTAALKQHGEDAILLVNLAKVQAAKGEQALAERTLRRALDLDPNERNALLWHAAIHEERGGAAGRRQALAEIANLRGSWRAQLWLARAALDEKNVAAALALYRQALAVEQPPPSDLLMQASGDLGNHGRLRELTELCTPFFDAARHGLVVGNNLIRAHLALGEVGKAQALIEQLHTLQRPDWRDTLTLWEGEIDKARRSGPPPEPGSLQLAVLTFEQPIWVIDDLRFDDFLPPKAEDAARVCFVTGSADVPGPAGGAIVAGQSDAVGRFSRGLPMFLTEQVFLRTALKPVFVLPWIHQRGFVLMGERWNADVVAHAGVAADHAVFLHVDGSAEPWRTQLSLVRLADRSVVAEWEQQVNPNDGSPAIAAILQATLERLRTHLDVPSAADAGDLRPPSGLQLLSYLGCLEQSLAVACAPQVPGGIPFLYQERAIFEAVLSLSLDAGDNAAARLLLLSALLREAQRRPDIVQEFRARIEALARERALADPINALAERVTAAILGRGIEQEPRVSCR